jgi:hypothetical protein
VSAAGPPPPLFPGGMETAPEATAGGCAHDACLCRGLAPGRSYCSLACAQAARAEVDTAVCPCGHFGCTGHQL